MGTPLARVRLLRLAAGCAAGAAAVGVVDAGRHASIPFPPPARQFSLAIGRGAESLLIGVDADGGSPRQITVVVDGKQASFLHHGSRAARYRVRLHGPADRARAAIVLAEPAASVAPEPGPLGLRTKQPKVRWEDAGPTLALPDPVAEGPGRTWAEASVDETDTWGLRLLGVPLRAAPAIDARLVSMAAHGDRLRARCWTTGDVVTNAFVEKRIHGYESDVWYQVETPGGPAFIPDVRFARRGRTDRLGLPPCDRPQLPGAGAGQ
ncbi:MAG: hypothetical protein ACT4PX_00470 [Actinomycetota bacterium]